MVGRSGLPWGLFKPPSSPSPLEDPPPSPHPLRVEQGSAWPASWRQTVGSRESNPNPLLAFPRIGSVLSEPEATKQKLVTSGLGSPGSRPESTA